MSAPRQVELSQNAFLRFFKQEQIAALGADIQRIARHAGEVIFQAGEAGDACYLIESGSVRITGHSPGGAEETFAVLGPGEFFGENALYADTPRSATATAVQATRLGRIDRSAFDRLRAIAPLEIASALAEANIERVRRTNATLVEELAAAGRLREVGTELTTIAHNLRSPLATVQNAAEVLLDMIAEGTASPERIVRFLEIIKRTTGKALQSTDALLASLRGERRAMWTAVRVADFVAGAEQQVSGLAAHAGATLSVRVSTGRALRVQGAELEAALVNLLRNAIEALPREGGRVTLAAEDEGDSVVFTVSDNGCGIAPENQGRIFEPRFTHGKESGTGLGLAHVRAVAERHRGTVELVESSEQGTTFRLVIPSHQSG
jgi:signal transduction histidine kinase